MRPHNLADPEEGPVCCAVLAVASCSFVVSANLDRSAVKDLSIKEKLFADPEEEDSVTFCCAVLAA